MNFDGMKKLISYSHSDSWILLSIIYSGVQNGAHLEEIIAAGDFINHAIFTFEELEGAFARLSKGKFIRRKGEYFFPSDKTMKFWKENQKARNYVHKDWERLNQFIHVKPRDNQVIPQKANEGVSYKGITREKYQQAIDRYLVEENK